MFRLFNYDKSSMVKASQDIDDAWRDEKPKQDSAALSVPSCTTCASPCDSIPTSPKCSNNHKGGPKFKLNTNPQSPETYELEIFDQSGGILTLESDDKENIVYIKKFSKTKCPGEAQNIMKKGDILLVVNEHVVLNDDFNDIVTYLETLRSCNLTRRLLFLNPSKCPLKTYIERSAILKTNSKVDMFGFNRKLDYLISERRFINNYSQVFSQRDLAWVDYLKSIGGPDNLKPAGVFRSNPLLKQLVRRGIPVAYRPLIWQKISLSSLHRREFPANYFSNLLLRCDTELDKRVLDDIEKDVDRTFPEHEYFGNQSGGENGEASLRRVLRCFALHNRQVGYCQSLNFIAGMMLLFMNEEDTFWLLVTVIETLLPKDYYTKSMVGIYADQCVLARIVQIQLPRIHELLESFQFQLPLITVQWFLCIFVNTFRPEITLRIWDMFLNEGSKVLFRIAVALFQTYEDELLHTKDGGELFLRLKELGKEVVDADALIAMAYKSYQPYSSASLSSSSSSRTGVSTLPLAGSTTPSSVSGSFMAYSSGGSSVATNASASANANANTNANSNASATATANLSLSSSTAASNNNSTARQVPKSLIGLGLAHIGPMALWRKKKKKTSSDQQGSDTKQSDEKNAAEDSESDSESEDIVYRKNHHNNKKKENLIQKETEMEEIHAMKDNRDVTSTPLPPLFEPDYAFMLDDSYCSDDDLDEEVEVLDIKATKIRDNDIDIGNDNDNDNDKSNISNSSSSSSDDDDVDDDVDDDGTNITVNTALSVTPSPDAFDCNNNPVNDINTSSVTTSCKENKERCEKNGNEASPSEKSGKKLSDVSMEWLRSRNTVYVPQPDGQSSIGTLISDFSKKGSMGFIANINSSQRMSKSKSDKSKKTSRIVMNFKRLEIQTWRHEYREQLEERYAQMQEIRRRTKHDPKAHRDLNLSLTFGNISI